MSADVPTGLDALPIVAASIVHAVQLNTPLFAVVLSVGFASWLAWRRYA